MPNGKRGLPFHVILVASLPENVSILFGDARLTIMAGENSARSQFWSPGQDVGADTIIGMVGIDEHHVDTVVGKGRRGGLARHSVRLHESSTARPFDVFQKRPI